jgi:hypothetical protein
MIHATLTEEDLEYVSANFLTLAELISAREETAAEIGALIARRRLPRPSYVLADGTGMFPADYFELVDDAGGVDELQAHFAERHRRAALVEGIRPEAVEQDWEAYLDGTYGVCLRRPTPETIVRKAALVSSLCELLVLAVPSDPDWRQALRLQVEELDTLEREFAPHWDRAGRFGRPPTRDLLIGAARERFPDVFADVASNVSGEALRA